jgi:hypothetical protein
MNVRLLMSDMGIPPLRLPVYHETASGFVGQPLNRSESRSSLRSLRRLLEAARNRLWEFLSLPNCALEVLIHARWHGLVVLIRNVFAYHFRVQEAVTANAAMPLVMGEDVRTPLRAFRIGIGHFDNQINFEAPTIRPTLAERRRGHRPRSPKSAHIARSPFGYGETQRFKRPPRVPA